MEKLNYELRVMNYELPFKGGGMMKRRILKTLETIKKKFVLSLILAGLTAINVGFTEQQEEIPPEPVAVEETSAEPTSIAIGENGRIKISVDDELTKEFARVVENSLSEENSEAVEELFEEVATVEEVPPENVVETPQGYVEYTQMLGMEATAYLPADGNGEGITATGIPATYGIVAVDPAIIPLGTRVYIPGYGEALAADTGGAIYGYKIDLCMEDYWQAMDFGRRTITVFVLK